MEWDQCLLMLGDAKVDEHGNVYETKDCNIIFLDEYGEDGGISVSLFEFFALLYFVFLNWMVRFIRCIHIILYLPRFRHCLAFINS